MDTGLAAENEKLGAAGATAGQVDETFGESYLRLRDPVFHYVRRFATDDDEAAELTARTFERALTRLSSYRGGRRGIAAWLFRIARSQAVDATRRRRPLHPLDLISFPASSSFETSFRAYSVKSALTPAECYSGLGLRTWRWPQPS